MKQLLVCALLTLGLNALSQSANRAIFQKGKGIELTSRVETVSKMAVMGESMETKGTTTITQKFDVENVTDTGAVIEQKMKSLQINMDGGMGQGFSFNSDNQEDMKGQMGEVMGAALKAKYKYNVNSKGVITYVEEQKEKKSDNELISGMMSQMNASADAPKVGGRIALLILPDREIKKGDSWTEESKAEGGTRKIVYTVRDITESDVVLDTKEEATVNTKQSMMGMEASVNGTTRSNGETIVDRKTGLLRQSKSTIEGEQTMEIQGQKMTSSSKATVITTVKSS